MKTLSNLLRWPLDASRTSLKPAATSLLALMVGLGLSAAAVIWQQGNLDLAGKTQFLHEADRIEAEVVRRFNLGQFGLKGLRGAYGINSQLTRSEFRAYVESRDLNREFRGIRGFGFVQRVMRPQLDAFVEQAQRDEAPDFAVRTQGPASDLWVVKYIEPAANNHEDWGYDMGQEAVRREGAERAMNTGAPALTDRLMFSHNGQATPGFFLFVPIYRFGTDPSTPTQRQAALLGLGYAPLVASELLTGVTGNNPLDPVFELFQGASPTPEQQIYPNLMPGSAGARHGKFDVHRVLDLAGSRFSLVVRSTPQSDANMDRSSLLLLGFSGAATSLLLAVAVWLLVAGRLRAQSQARAATADLDRMALVAQHTNNAVTISDANSRITWVNAGFTRVTGYTAEEARGKRPNELIDSGKANPETLALLASAASRGESCRVEVLNRAKDGREYWADTEIQAIHDAEGTLTGFMEIGTDITQQKRTQQRLEVALRDASALLTTLEIHAIVSVSDGAGVITDVNEAYCDVSGYTREELIGKTHDIVNSGHHSAEFWAQMWATVSQGGSWRADICNRAKDGSVFWVDSMIAPFIGDDGKVDKFVSICTNITARIQDQQKLATLSDRMALAIEGGSDGLWDWMDVTQDAQWWAPNFYALFGHSPESMRPCAANYLSLLHPESIRESNRAIKTAFGGGAPLDMECQMLTKDRGYRWFRTRAKVYFDANGKAVRMAGATQDITERRQTAEALRAALAKTEASEAELRHSQEVLRSSIEALDDAFVLFDAEDRLVLCNERYREFYPETLAMLQPGNTFESIIRYGAEQGQYLAAQGRVEDWVQERLALHQQPHSRMLQRLRGGRILRVVERQTEGGYTVGFRVDITDLVLATETAEEASRSKSQFLANMSHEIRTPMNAILGMLQLLQNTELTPRQEDYAIKTESAARSLLGLLNDILDFSKVEAGKMTLDPRTFRPEKLLRDLSVILSANVGQKDVEVLFDIDPALPKMLVGDDMRLQQVLINLGGNAIKFTSVGQVVLGLRVAKTWDDAVDIEFSVKDSGIGIAPENQGHIFSGFSQAEANTTRRFGGTGLGLAISSRLTTLLGGELKLESALGEGSRFYFQIRLALAPDAPAPATRTRPGAAALPADTRPCLVVDDNPVALTIMVQLLQSQGWQVDTAATGEEAIRKVQESRDREQTYRAIFVDWHMPVMDGWQVSREIRRLIAPTPGKANPRTLLVMVTSHGRDMLAQRSATDQAMLDGFLIKPVTAMMLQEAIHEAESANSTAERGRNPMAPKATNKPKRLLGMRLLVVEDNKINQMVAKGVLSAEGALITLADDGQLGVDAVANMDPAFDVVLMDLQMPVMDGYAATHAIRNDLGLTTLPIVAMTANAMASDRAACLAAGMNDHVGKPFELDHLVATLLRITGRVPSTGTESAPKST